MEPALSDAKYRQYLVFSMFILTAIAISFALVFTRPVLMPFVFAVFYYVASLPCVEFLEKKLRTPSILSVLITFVLFGGASSVVFIHIGLSFNAFIHEANNYQDSFLAFADQMIGYARQWGFEVNGDSLRSLLSAMPITSYARQLIGSTFSFIGTTFLAMVIYFFLMMGRTQSKREGIYSEIERKISSYVIYKVVLSALTGVLVAGILLAFDIDLAIAFGIVTALLNFIPSIGSMIATLLPIPIIALQHGLGLKLLVIFALCTLVQIIIGNIIDPKLVGKDLDLHPIVIILSLVFWGLIWGIGGMFLAVPLTAIVKIVLARLEFTFKISEFMAGRL